MQRIGVLGAAQRLCLLNRRENRSKSTKPTLESRWVHSNVVRWNQTLKSTLSWVSLN